MKKVIVTYQIPKDGLRNLFKDYEITYPESMEFSYEEVLRVIPEYDAIIGIEFPAKKEFINAATKLKIISNYGAGYNTIDIPYATQKGIAVTNTPDQVTEPTAELALGLMLSVTRRISECDRNLRLDKNFKWGKMTYLGTVLYGKTLGIIGMGRIGKALARRCIASGMKIVYHNRHRMDPETEDNLNATYLTMEELLKQSDVVSLNTPLNDNTFHLIGEKELGLMKPSAFLINVSRGSVIDEKALVKCLKDKKIKGAGLDVFEKEPGISEELLEMDNVVLTPHFGTQTTDTRTEMAKCAADNIIDFFEGKQLKYLINPEFYD